MAQIHKGFVASSVTRGPNSSSLLPPQIDPPSPALAPLWSERGQGSTQTPCSFIAGVHPPLLCQQHPSSVLKSPLQGGVRCLIHSVFSRPLLQLGQVLLSFPDLGVRGGHHPGCTMSSCLWVSSTGTLKVSFSCLLTLWKRFRVAILMVPSMRVFLAAVF